MTTVDVGDNVIVQYPEMKSHVSEKFVIFKSQCTSTNTGTNCKKILVFFLMF